MELSSIVQQNDNSVFCEIEDQTVLLNVVAGKYHGFNEAASRIWQLISTPIEIRKICDELTNEFLISQKECQAETLQFLEKLKEIDLIVVTG
jgi:Coenzyme PQQ synthesis protein D (PqqD)